MVLTLLETKLNFSRQPVVPTLGKVCVLTTDFLQILNALIISNSEILETSSELIQTSSELISTRSELNSAIAELFLTIAHRVAQTTVADGKINGTF